MAARPSWDGFLKFNLIAVPVKAYGAMKSGGGKIGLHLIHKGCNSRIRYKKVCPIHGEVNDGEIVSAYERAKGEYIVVDADERKGLRLENDKAIAIDVFIRPAALDPIYFSDRTYYLVPDGQVAQKPYTVLREAMARDNRYAIAQVVMSGQGRIAVVRPMGPLLAMTLLSFEEQIKKPSAFADEVVDETPSAQETKLAEALIEAATAKKFDLGRYKDEYTAKLVKLLETKGRSKKRVVNAPNEEEPAVINLMDALRESLKAAQHADKPKRAKKSSAGPRHSKRKTG